MLLLLPEFGTCISFLKPRIDERLVFFFFYGGGGDYDDVFGVAFRDLGSSLSRKIVHSVCAENPSFRSYYCSC